MTDSRGACVIWSTRFGEFDALGIQFVSLHEGVDTSTLNGRLVFGIFASIADLKEN